MAEPSIFCEHHPGFGACASLSSQPDSTTLSNESSSTALVNTNAQTDASTLMLSEPALTPTSRPFSATSAPNGISHPSPVPSFISTIPVSIATTASSAAPPTWEIAVPATLGGCALVVCVFVGLRVHRRRRHRLEARTKSLDLEQHGESEPGRSTREEDAKSTAGAQPLIMDYLPLEPGTLPHDGSAKPRELAWRLSAIEQKGLQDSALAATRDSVYPSSGATVGTVLSMPDPARDVVRVGQQRALDKLEREQQRLAAANQPGTPSTDLVDADLASFELLSVSAPASPSEADCSTVLSGGTADLDLRTQVGLLRRRLLNQQAQLNQVTLVAERLAEEQRERESRPTAAALDVPPAYEDD